LQGWATPLDGHIGAVTLGMAFGGLAMARRRSAAPIALVALLAPAMAAAQAPTLSKTQVRALTPAEATARVMDQLGDILILAQPPRSGRKPTRPLRDLDFVTVPRATYIPGVCARDQVIVTFEPTGADAAGPDTPVRASSLSARTAYRLLAPPPRDDDYYDNGPPPAAREACGRLGRPGATESFFLAPTAEAALSGAWWLTQLARQAATPEPGFTLDCKPGSGPTNCTTIAQSLTLDQLSSVDPCAEDWQGPAPLACWEIETWTDEGPYELRVFVTRGEGAQLARVEMTQEVYTAEQRID
jgi:hypothetical protein